MLVGAFATFIPGDIVGDMTSIGTLFAFILVCAGVWIMRVKHPEIPRGFKVPAVKLVAILGILSLYSNDLWFRMDKLGKTSWMASYRFYHLFWI